MSAELVSLIKLLDDPDPTVKTAVEEYFTQFEGDISEEIAGEAISLSHVEKKLLSQYLLPGRRRTLAQNWLIPDRFQHADCNDFETFEFLLSLLSDYLHDGITLRPSLADSIDQLMDEIHLAEVSSDVDQLSRFLFGSGRFMGNRNRYFAKENSDLVWVTHNTLGNPISLVVLYMLIANRFGLTVQGCNYPGHFLAWIPSSEKRYLIDAYNRGRILNPEQIMLDNPSITENARKALNTPCSLRVIMNRMLNNIETSLAKEGLEGEISFIQRLKKSLFPSAVA